MPPNRVRKIAREIKTGIRPDDQVFNAKLGTVTRRTEWRTVQESVDFSQTVVDGIERYDIRVTNRNVTDSWTYKTIEEYGGNRLLISYETKVVGPHHYVELYANNRTILLAGEYHSQDEPYHVRQALSFPSIVIDVFRYDPRAKLFVETHDDVKFNFHVGTSMHRMDSVSRLYPERTFNYDIRHMYEHDPTLLLSKYEELMRPFVENNPIALKLVDEALVNTQRWIKQILPFSVDTTITPIPGYVYGRKYDHSEVTMNEGINRLIMRDNFSPNYAYVSDDTWDEYEGSLVEREHRTRNRPLRVANLPGNHVHDIVRNHAFYKAIETARVRRCYKAHNNREYWKAHKSLAFRQTLFSRHDSDSSSDVEDGNSDIDAHDAEVEATNDFESDDPTDDKFNSDTTGIERPDHYASTMNDALDEILTDAFMDLTDLHLALLLDAEESQISMAYVGEAHIKGICKYLRVIGSWRTNSEKKDSNRDMVDMKFRFNVPI